jgi:hypothetical protein
MGLKVQAYPGFQTYTQQVATSAQAEFVASMMVHNGRHCYSEPLCDGRWFFVVNTEHERALQGYIVAAEVLHPHR